MVSPKSFRWRLGGSFLDLVRLERAVIGYRNPLLPPMDPAAERVLLELVERLKRAHDLSVVLVTHQLTAVAGFASEVALVDRARGLFEVGPAREMITPDRLGR